MNIYVQVYDVDNAFTIYEIAQAVSVYPDSSGLENIMNKLISSDPYFSSNIILNQGSYLGCLQEIQTISSLMNEQSLSDKYAISLNSSLTLKVIFPQMYGPLAQFTGVSPVIILIIFILCFDLFQIKNITKSLNLTADQFELNRNQRAKTRLALAQFVNGLSISDMDSVKTQAGMLHILSSQTDEITRITGVNQKNLCVLFGLCFDIFLKKDIIMNQCIRLMESLVSYAYLRPIDEVEKANIGILSVLGNIRSVILKLMKNICDKNKRMLAVEIARFWKVRIGSVYLSRIKHLI